MAAKAALFIGRKDAANQPRLSAFIHRMATSWTWLRRE